MAFLIGRVGTFFLIGFLIVHFGMKKTYEEKNGVPMSVGQVIGRTIGIGFVLLCVTLLSAIV